MKGFLFGDDHDRADLDDVMASSAQGIRTLAVTTAVLVGVFVVEFSLVAFTGSVGLLGDAIHNGADAATALPLGFAFWLQRRPATRRYTYGYGRAEDLAGALVCVVIACSAVVTGWIAVDRLLHPAHVHHLGVVAAAGLIGFVGNEAVALYRIRSGRSLGSAALVADGRHARVDGLTSLAVVAGAAGVAAGWTSADAVVGLAICAVILKVLVVASTDILHRLMDSVDPALIDQVESALRTVDGVEGVGEVRLRWIGHRLEAEATIVSDGELSLSAAHDVAVLAHGRLLREVPRLSYALIHSEPAVGGTCAAGEPRCGSAADTGGLIQERAVEDKTPDGTATAS